MNPLLLIDGYKLDHRRQYPNGTSHVYSNWTPRSSRIPGEDRVVFFGLQYFLQRYLLDEMQRGFFSRPRADVEKEYQRRVDSYLGPNSIGTSHIAALHELGYIPLEFRAMPEGTRCPLRVPSLVIENTHEDFAWLVNYIETIMSGILWMPCTSATSAYRLRRLLNAAANKTGGDPAFVQWQGHDFSMRGMAGLEAAQMSGAGHLLSFTGTDTIPAIEWIETFYRGENGLIGGSVPATEHSVMCAGGDISELDTFRRLLQLYSTGVVSVVSDTWDLWKVCNVILPQLKREILARDGKLVIRPDSGDPVKIICGDKWAANPDAVKGVVELLWDVFGGTTTSTGHRLLDSHIGVIYGDAITFDRAKAICEGLEAKGFASTNMVFGVGSYTYQYVTRDTYGFAMKATWARVNGKGIDLFKKPVTDDGVKNSATGRLAVIADGDSFRCIERADLNTEAQSVLKPVWRDGAFIKYDSFDTVRKTLWLN